MMFRYHDYGLIRSQLVQILQNIVKEKDPRLDESNLEMTVE